MTKKDKETVEGSENQGEGNKTAAKEYDDAATKHAKSGNVEKEAKSARDALEGKEGAELQRAEDEGKSHIAEEDPELRNPKA